MCDTLLATGSHTALGSTLFAKNSDRSSGECQPLVQFPAAVHPRGARVQATHVSIPQVAETYRILGHSPWWVWGFEHGVNEYGVAIGNHTVFSKEPVELTPGLIGMDLVRLGLERGRDAREALEVIASLLETHGQGGAALGPDGAGYHNSFMIADPQEAWVMETSGRRWAARGIEMGALTNHMTLGADWGIGSRDLESFARSEGWWLERGRVDLAAAYRNRNVPDRLTSGRLRRSEELLAAADGRLGREHLEAALRDHGGEGVPPPVDATPEDERYFTLCMHSEPISTTTASLIAPLPTDRSAPWPVWVSFATPCTSIFIPVYLAGAIPASLARGGETPDGDSAWWSLHALQEAASADFPRHIPALREAWRELEEKIEAERQELEAAARAACLAGKPEDASRSLSDFMEATASDVISRATDLRNRISA